MWHYYASSLKLKHKIQIKNSLIYIHVNLNSQIL